MMEIGIFSKELHDATLRNNGNEQYIDTYIWVNVADEKEAIFHDSVANIGYVAISTGDGIIELLVRREWCKDFKPLSDF